MKKILLALFLALPLPAIAADNALVVTTGSGLTMRTKDIGAGVQSPVNILGDTSGNPIYGTAGVANSNVITIQGIASGTVVPVSLTSTTITGTVAATQSGTWTVQQGNTANTTAWLVTGTGGTFPATQSGTWTVQPGNTANTTPWLTTISQGGNSATVSAGGALKVDGSAVTQPVSAASLPLPSGASTSANQTNGTQQTKITDGSNIAAVKAASTVPVATDPALVVSISPNSVNSNGQKTSANSAPIVIASDQSVGDPCTFQAKSNAPFSSASGTFAIVTGVSAKKIYVCSLSIVAPSAVSFSLAEGSSSTCGTSNQAAVIGVATSGTAANGLALAANGGLTLGNGTGTVAQTATAANYLCGFQSGTAQLAGNITYVQQ